MIIFNKVKLIADSTQAIKDKFQAPSANPDSSANCVESCPLKQKQKKNPSDECMYEAFNAKTEAAKKKIEKYLDPLRNTMNKYGIDTAEKKALFLGQVSVETENLTEPQEKEGYRTILVDGKRHDYKEVTIKGEEKELIRKRKTDTSLNPANIDASQKWKEAGEHEELTDTKNYFDYLAGGDKDAGRGALHLTHEENYKQYFAQHKKDEPGMPELDYNKKKDLDEVAKDPNLVADSAGWVWKTFKLNKYTQVNDKNVKEISRAINRGSAKSEKPALKESERIDNTKKMEKIFNKKECQQG